MSDIKKLAEEITSLQVEVSYAEHEGRKEDRRELQKKLTRLIQDLHLAKQKEL
jgi:hypothetical protein|tara:strand:+ start:1407 stop:1565 length:159 start_codon:yes stop_codon:yes gene_type:complete